MNQNKTLIVQDSEGQELKSFSFEERELAFIYLQELEEWGIEATLKEPSLPESLINCLGASDEDRKKLKETLEQEIDDHDDSCCFSKKKLLND